MRPSQDTLRINYLRNNLRHAQKFSQNVRGISYNTTMNEQKIRNEIDQYLRTLMAKGFSETEALAFAFATAYSLLTDDQIDDLFALLSKV